MPQIQSQSIQSVSDSDLDAMIAKAQPQQSHDDLSKLSDAELDAEIQKTPPDSIFKNINSGNEPIQSTLGYIKEHPFKSNFQSAIQNVTGKSGEQIANEAVQGNKDLGQSSTAPFDKNLGIVQPVALGANITGQAADIATTPFTYEGGAILKGAAKVAEKIPNAMRGVAGRIGNFMIKLPDKAVAYGKDPEAVMADEKIPGNTITDYAANAKARLSQRRAELKDEMASSDKSVNVKNIIDNHSDNAKQQLIGSTLDRTSDIKNLNNIKTQFTKDYGDLSNLSVQDALKMKQTLADDYPFTHENSTDVVANAAHKMYHDISDAIETAEPSIAPLNQKVSSLIDISKAAQKRVNVESRNNPIGLIGTILGATVGSHIGGIQGGAEGAIAGIGTALLAKAAASPAVLTRVANTLSTMADADKIHLFEVSPDFMALAKKAFQFKENHSLGMAGEAGSAAEATGNPEEAMVAEGGPAPATETKPFFGGAKPLPQPEEDLTNMAPGRAVSTSPAPEKFDPAAKGKQDFAEYEKNNPLLAEKWRKTGKFGNEGFARIGNESSGDESNEFGAKDTYVYHLHDKPITKINLRSFKKNGILPSSEDRGYSGAGVYMGNTPKNTEYYASSDASQKDAGTLFRIDKEALIKKFGKYPQNPDGVQFDPSNGEILLAGNKSIPPEMIQVRGHDGEWRDLSSDKQLKNPLAISAATGVGAAAALGANKASASDILPEKEKSIIQRIAKSYSLNPEQTKMLMVIRKVENGGAGKEFGVLTPQAQRFKNNPEKSFEIQAKWAAGSIKNHYNGNIDKFARRWAPKGVANDPNNLNANWARNAKFYMQELNGGKKK